jgi:hypothetical protein
MKYPSIGVFLGTLGWAVACGGSDEESKKSEGDGDGDESEAALEVATISFDLDQDRALSSLTDEEIRAACDEMAVVFRAADEGVACQIVAASEATTEACESSRDACLADPDDALQETTVRSAPAPVDCSIFEARLTAACDFPVSLLEDCVNALAQSVVPAAQAAHCENASEIEDVAEAHGLAVDHLNTDYASVCFELLQCEDLVGALLSGESPMGAGGASDE